MKNKDKYKFNKSFLTKIANFNEEMLDYAGQMEMRVEYIYNYIFKIMDFKKHTWEMPSDEMTYPNNIFSLLSLVSINSPEHRLAFKVISHKGNKKNFHHKDNAVFIDKNGEEQNLSQGIPQRWLFEDFETELVSGFAAYRKQVGDKALKQQALINTHHGKKFVFNFKMN